MYRPVRRVTANIPTTLLEEAREVTGKGITETISEGLRLLGQRRFAARARALRGKLRLEIDLDTSRARRRR